MCMGSDTSFSCMYIHVRVIAQVCCRSTCTAHHEFKTSLAGHTREQTMKVVNPPWTITQQVCYSMQEPRHGVLWVFTEGGTTWKSTNEHLNNMYTCTYTCSVAEHGRYFCNKCASTCTVYLVDSPTDISWSILLTLSPNSPSCPSSLPSPPWQPGEKKHRLSSTPTLRQEMEAYRTTVQYMYKCREPSTWRHQPWTNNWLYMKLQPVDNMPLCCCTHHQAKSLRAVQTRDLELLACTL